jgi:hypothetical protein
MNDANGVVLFKNRTFSELGMQCAGARKAQARVMPSGAGMIK